MFLVASLLVLALTDTVPARPASGTSSDSRVAVGASSDAADSAKLAPPAHGSSGRRPAPWTSSPLYQAPSGPPPILTLRDAEYRVAADTDTVPGAEPAARRRRPAAPVVEYSDAYTRRLNWHRWVSYPIVPLFALQWYLGNRLLDNQQDALWVRDGHRIVATATAGIYTFNTATGLWNLWEGRSDPSGRFKKWLHAAMFTVADAGFIYGGFLAKDAQLYGQVYRERHRNVELASMGLSIASWAMMLFLKD